MEKKKLLLVAVSVGVFLVIVIGASILVFSPRNLVSGPVTVTGNRSNSNNTRPAGPATVDPTELVRNTDNLQGSQSPLLDGPSPVDASLPRSGFYENSAAPAPVVINVPRPSAASGSAPPPSRTSSPEAVKTRSQSAPSSGAAPSNNRTTNTTSRTTNTGNSNTTANKTTSRSNSDTTTAGRTTPATANKNTPPANKNTGAGNSRNSASTAGGATPQSVNTSYWVQTGSFSTLTRADGVKETLASKGITSIIEDRNMDGKTYYRVRVGPYTSQNEADYWLALIKSIDGFEGSQVWRTPR